MTNEEIKKAKKDYMSDDELIRMEGKICNSIRDIIHWLTRWPDQIVWDDLREALEHIEGWKPVPEDYLLDGFHPEEHVVLAIYEDWDTALLEKKQRYFVGRLNREDKKRIFECI